MGDGKHDLRSSIRCAKGKEDGNRREQEPERKIHCFGAWGTARLFAGLGLDLNEQHFDRRLCSDGVR